MKIQKTNALKPLAAALAALAALIVFVCPAFADTQYIIDQMSIGVRSTMDPGSEVVKYVRTGAPLEVLEESGDYFKVRTTDGLEGWILKRYLTPETPKAKVIERLTGDVDRLKAKIAEMTKERDSLQEQIRAEKGATASTKQEVSAAGKELKDITEKYGKLLEASGNVTAIVEERDKLKEESTRLAAVEEHLQQENERLRKKGGVQWFVAGAAVFLVGWLAGKLSRGKKRYY